MAKQRIIEPGSVGGKEEEDVGRKDRERSVIDLSSTPEIDIDISECPRLGTFAGTP